MVVRSSAVSALLFLGLAAQAARAEDALPPKEIKVFPVFYVPKGEDPPTPEQTKKLVQHLEAARTRYGELLPEKITFSIADEKPRVFRSKIALAPLRAEREDGAPQIVSELLADLKRNRFNCPYVLLTVVMNSRDDFPGGGGRPLNGGFNTGGGIVLASSFALDRSPNFQSNLQHHLGHGFGLPAVDAYGLNMKTDASIMSFNPKHHSVGFAASLTPGVFNPEDVWGLSLNQRAFPKLRFDPKADAPKGRALAARPVPFGPMKIPNHPGVEVTTDSGEESGSKVANIVQGQIGENEKTGKVTFNAATMWHSAKTKTGWVSVQVTFPFDVDLTGLAVHSQHSGEYHAARAVRVSVKDPKGQFRAVGKGDLNSADDSVKFPKTKARVWRFEFQAATSANVVLRGLQFYSGAEEMFPTLVPMER